VEVVDLDHGRGVGKTVFGTDDEAFAVDGGQRVDGDVEIGELDVGVEAEFECGDDTGFESRAKGGDVEAEEDADAGQDAEQEPEEDVASSLRHPD